MKQAALIIPTLLLCACATVEIPERVQKIQVHNQMSTLLSNCKNLGPVSAEGTNGSLYPVQGVPQAKLNARLKVSDVGGDTLVILNTDYYEGSWIPREPAKAVIQGVAMKCY